MRQLLLSLGTLAIAACLLSGCDNTARLTGEDIQAFKSAPAELKAAWQKGLSAEKTNDFLTAGMTFRSLLGQDLTPEQSQAVQTALTALNQRMYAAAAKGDGAAQKAVEALQGASQRGR